jgi:NADH:ubiquinone oxidoreductase subunit K
MSTADVGLVPYLVVAAFLAACGLACLATKRNAVGALMGVELLLNGANLNLVAFGRYVPGLAVEGPVFALFGIVLAAAEAAVALAIVLSFYNTHTTVDVDSADELKG